MTRLSKLYGMTEPGRDTPLPRVIFVDDEPRILEGLRRMLHGARTEWHMTFESDPTTALETMRGEPFDALVTDMRMPKMDGTELLARAREIRPGMARIVLSGYTEREVAVRSVALAHQFLVKPCNAGTLKATVSRVCSLRTLLDEAGLAETICRLGTLPSLPALYRAITDEVSRDDMSLARAARIVSKDLAMTAKVLQLVNSAFFGLGKRVFDIEEGVNYLGTEIIRALVASNGAFSAFDMKRLEPFEDLWRHSLSTGLLAARIAEMACGGDRLMQGEALQAGMLHDVGQLALAARLPREYRSVRMPDEDLNASISMRERSIIGCDHGRIGAYMMGLWGLSDRIVEALAYHHCPSECSFSGWSPLTAVHAANALVNEQLGRDDMELDWAYLGRVGCAKSVDSWRNEAERIVLGAEDLCVLATTNVTG
jgi:HD-like signal output (HDOD) protein